MSSWDPGTPHNIPTPYYRIEQWPGIYQCVTVLHCQPTITSSTWYLVKRKQFLLIKTKDHVKFVLSLLPAPSLPLPCRVCFYNEIKENSRFGPSDLFYNKSQPQRSELSGKQRNSYLPQDLGQVTRNRSDQAEWEITTSERLCSGHDNHTGLYTLFFLFWSLQQQNYEESRPSEFPPGSPRNRRIIVSTLIINNTRLYILCGTSEDKQRVRNRRWLDVF